MATTIHSFSTKIYVNNGSYTEIPSVKQITFNREKDTIDVSHLNSTELNKEFLSSWKSSTVDFDIWYDPLNAVHAYLITAYNAQSSYSFRIVASDASTTQLAQFSAIVTGIPTTFDMGDAVVMSVSLQVTGVIS